MPPVLYSFRRCPFAIRARMTLAYSNISVEHREVLLRNKPQEMLDISAKATVPILSLASGVVLDESRDIMRWALNQYDPQCWWRDVLAEPVGQLIDESDSSFKPELDRYKYSERFPERSRSYYRTKGEAFLLQLEQLLALHPYLLSNQVTMADIALFPFIRQFAMVDLDWFDKAPYPKLKFWLQDFLASSLFLSVMTKVPAWKNGDAPFIVLPAQCGSA
jgi:glutathione S-transferase